MSTRLRITQGCNTESENRKRSRRAQNRHEHPRRVSLRNPQPRSLPALSDNHQHWTVDRELQRWFARDPDLEQTVRSVFRGLDTVLGDADVVAYVERDIDGPPDPRPSLQVTLPVDSVEGWNEKQSLVREIVNEAEQGDAILYDRVDRRRK